MKQSVCVWELVVLLTATGMILPTPATGARVLRFVGGRLCGTGMTAVAPHPAGERNEVQFIDASGRWNTRDFVKKVIAARDPGGRFKDVKAVVLENVRFSGLFFRMNGAEREFSGPLTIVSNLKEGSLVFEGFPEPGMKTIYRPEKIVTLSRDGVPVSGVEFPLSRLHMKKKEIRAAAEASVVGKMLKGTGLVGDVAKGFFGFLGTGTRKKVNKDNRLDPILMAAFFGYATRDYIDFPDQLVDPGRVVSVAQTGDFELTVIFNRESSPTHSVRQVYRFDPQTLLLKEHFYTVDYINPALNARHETENYQAVDGIALPLHRTVRLNIGDDDQTAKAIEATIGGFKLIYDQPGQNGG